MWKHLWACFSKKYLKYFWSSNQLTCLASFWVKSSYEKNRISIGFLHDPREPPQNRVWFCAKLIFVSKLAMENYLELVYNNDVNRGIFSFAYNVIANDWLNCVDILIVLGIPCLFYWRGYKRNLVFCQISSWLQETLMGLVESDRGAVFSIGSFKQYIYKYWNSGSIFNIFLKNRQIAFSFIPIHSW